MRVRSHLCAMTPLAGRRFRARAGHGIGSSQSAQLERTSVLRRLLLAGVLSIALPLGASQIGVVTPAAATDGYSTITVGGSPLGVGLSPDGSRLYVANSSDSNVSVVDVATASIVATVSTFVNPTVVAVSPDGSSIWVGSGESWSDSPRGVTVIDAATLSTQGIEHLGVTAMEFTPDGREVWASLEGWAGVEVFDTQTLQHSRVSPDGVAFGVAFDRTGQLAYVSSGTPHHHDSGSITVYDAHTRQEVTWPRGGLSPAPIEITGDGTRLYSIGYERELVATELSLSSAPYRFAVDARPTGLAIDVERERLLITTHNQYASGGEPTYQLLLVDIPSGRTVWSQAMPMQLVHQAISLDGSFAFLSSPYTGEVVRVELPPSAPVDALVDRVAGSDRYDTAIQISRAGFADGSSPIAYLATGENFPDALSAAPAAARADAPVLLTPRTSLPPSLLAELHRLGVETVKIVGDTPSVSEAVASQVREAGIDVQRIGGPDRYSTSRAINADAFGESGVEVVYVATGGNFPDALSAAAAAGARNSPVLLVPPTLPPQSSGLDEPTHAALLALQPREAIVVGGTPTLPADISRAVQDSVQWVTSLEHPTRRIWGTDRFETSKFLSADAFAAADRVFVATGLNYPDALSGAAYAGSIGAPLFVTPTDCVPTSILRQIGRMGADRVTLLGGTPSLSARLDDLSAC